MKRLVALLGLLAGCKGDSCLDGRCPDPCAKLAFTCTPRALYVGRVADAPAEDRLVHGEGADTDTLVSNGIVTAVFSAPEHDNDLAPTGGNLIDYGPAGGVDDLTLVYQLAGILPDDAFAYRTLDAEVVDGVARVTLRGQLDGRPEVPVFTRYELGPCDPGLRVRSELFNGTSDIQAFMIADASHWGKRRIVPFVPADRQGYEQPELELVELAKLWDPVSFASGATPNGESPGYGALACAGETLSGVSDLEISALGTAMEFVEPGESVSLERMLITAGSGQGPAPAIDQVVAARAQLFPQPLAQVTGRVVAGGLPFGGDVRRASVLVRAGGRPVTAVVPAADGTFHASVPAGGAISVEVWSFGRQVATANGPDAGDIAVALPARLQVTIASGAEPSYGLVALDPADDATRAAVTGTFHGRQTACAPWLGPVNGSSPACNRALIEPQGTEIEVPAGNYRIYATAGPEHTLAAKDVTLVEGEITPVAFTLQPLAVAPAGWLTADLHVHGRASFDSGFPDEDRVKSFVAAGVQVIAATDHDVIGDYTETVHALGLDGQIAVLGGLEATQLIPWLDVPGETVPRVIGHFNFFPLMRVPGAPRAGAPSDERIEPGELFDRMAPLVGEGGLMMLNHPWDDPLFGRDLGYLRAIKFHPLRPIVEDDETNGMLLHRPAGNHRNLDWNLIEIMNGGDATEMQKARVLWQALLAQGFVTAGAGNSDSHGLGDQQLGWSRNWVDAGTTVASFNAATFDAAIRDGRFVAGSGVVVTVEVGQLVGPRRGVGLTPYHPVPGDYLFITVKAAPWIPVEEVRVMTSRGTQIIASSDQIQHPKDPFGTATIERFSTNFPLNRMFDPTTGADDFIVVEAGMPYPLAEDQDGDGVPDVSDNDGDGDIDDDDGDDLTVRPDPTDPADPRFYVTRVVPETWPEGFANPILIDVTNDGWVPPGLPKKK